MKYILNNSPFNNTNNKICTIINNNILIILYNPCTYNEDI